MHGRLLKIRQIDGNLRQVARLQLHPHRLRVPQSTGREANRFGNLVRNPHIGRVQVHVVRN